MTLRELAKLTSYSVSTVSKAFHGAEDISENTREEIFKVAREHGCFGKYYKDKYQKKIIAIICPELRSEHYASFVEQLQTRIEKDDGMVLISTDHFSAARRSELIEYYASFLAVDGILVFHQTEAPKRGFDVPVISLLSYREDIPCDSVRVNVQKPVCDAVAHLKQMGHRKIAFIGESLTKPKADYFREAMLLHGLPCPEEAMIESPYRFEQAGKEGMSALLDTTEGYTAALCAYDYIATGALKTLAKRGLSVPEDFSVIGMDDISAAAFMGKELTSIASGLHEVCDTAWELLQKKMTKGHSPLYQQITITGELILRETTGPAPKR